MFKMNKVMILFALIAMLGVAVVGCQKEPIVEPGDNETVVEPELVSLTGTVWEGPGFMESGSLTLEVDNELGFYTDSTGYYKVWYYMGTSSLGSYEYVVKYEFDGVLYGRVDILSEAGEVDEQCPLLYDAEEDALTLVHISPVPNMPDSYWVLHRKVE